MDSGWWPVTTRAHTLALSLVGVYMCVCVQVLDLSVDLSKLPGTHPTALLPKRVLGLRWYESVQRRQQAMGHLHMMSLEDYKARSVMQGTAHQ